MISPVPARMAMTSPLRRTSQVVLVSGAVLSAAAAFGPVWVVRAGVGLAMIAGVLACAYAWRELSQTRRTQAQQLLASSRAHGQALSEERKHNASVVEVLAQRASSAQTEVERQRVTLATLTGKISTLDGDTTYLKVELRQRELTISSLRETVRAREAELIALSDEGDDAEVHAMPRRVLAEHEPAWTGIPTADEVWADSSHPTVVDLLKRETATVLPNSTVMPNYEEERQQA